MCEYKFLCGDWRIKICGYVFNGFFIAGLLSKMK